MLERLRWMCLLLIYGYVNDDIVQVVNEAHEFMLKNQSEKVRQKNNPRPEGEFLGVRHKTSDCKKMRDDAKKLFREAKRIRSEWDRGSQRRRGTDMHKYFRLKQV